MKAKAVDRITIIIEMDGYFYQFHPSDFGSAQKLCDSLAKGTGLNMMHKANLVSKIVKNKFGKTAK